MVRAASLAALTAPVVRKAYRPLLEGRITIFMLHRLADPPLGVPGHDPELLRWCLGWLRDRDYSLLSVEEAARHLREGEPLPPTSVCFTIDDGYYDFFRVGLPVFREFDCPVTVFLPTGFIDGECWLWWDRVAHALELAGRTQVEAESLDDVVRQELPASSSQKIGAPELVFAMARLPEPQKEGAILSLARSLGVSLPEAPPAQYRPMTWEEVSASERQGVRFGPHTMTHPVLARTSDDRARREIMGSHRRLQSALERPSTVFCYPKGSREAFGAREEELVADCGLEAAVSTLRGYAVQRTTASGDGPSDIYRLPRLGLPHDRQRFLQIASGLLRLRQRLGF